MKIILIAAHGQNREIGVQGQLPWRLPEDLAFFRAQTWGKTVLMGRKTAQSLKGPLRGRENWVLSRQGQPIEGMTVFTSAQAALSIPVDELLVIGGGEIYTQFLPLADQLIITRVEQTVPEADAFFPAYPEWQCAAAEPWRHSSQGVRFRFEQWNK